MNNLNSIIPNRRGSQTQQDGKSWELSVAETFNYQQVQDMTSDQLSFINQICCSDNENIDLSQIRMVDIKTLSGCSKIDSVLTFIPFNCNSPNIEVFLQLKSIGGSTQFFQGNAEKFTHIFSHLYPLAAIGIQKLVGYGKYAKEAQLCGAGGFIKQNMRADYRFLVNELEKEEREEIRGIFEDPEIFKSIVSYITMGHDIKKPKYCIFPIIDRSVNPSDWRIINYEKLIDFIMKKPLYLNCSIYDGDKILPSSCENSLVGIKASYFNLKMKDAGKNDSSGHMLQINASPKAIYSDLYIK